jgi:hypothetical protein
MQAKIIAVAMTLPLLVLLQEVGQMLMAYVNATSTAAALSEP